MSAREPKKNNPYGAKKPKGKGEIILYHANGVEDDPNKRRLLFFLLKKPKKQKLKNHFLW